MDPLSATSKRGWARWARDTNLPSQLDLTLSGMTSQFFWEQMNRIPVGTLHGIERKIAARALESIGDELDLVLYDPTNFYTYIASTNTRCKLPQRGKNKQKRYDLRQIGLALLATRGSRIPLWHRLYEGQKPDVSLFPEVLSELRKQLASLAADMEDVTLIYDRGNNASKANQALVDSSELHYVGGLTPSNHTALIREANKKMESVEVRQGEIVRAWRGRRKIWGAERTVIVLVSEELRKGQIRGLDQHLKKRWKKLEDLEEALSNPRAKKRTRDKLQRRIRRILSGQRVREILEVDVLEKEEEGRFDIRYGIDEEAYNTIISEEFGRRILITDRHDWSTPEIILAYRGQLEIEENFKHLKDPFHMALRPQYHWTDQKIEVHAFCCVLGYLLARMVHTRVVQKTTFNGSLHSLMELLGQIRRATVIEKEKGRRSPPRALKVLDYPEDSLLDELIEALDIVP